MAWPVTAIVTAGIAVAQVYLTLLRMGVCAWDGFHPSVQGVWSE